MSQDNKQPSKYKKGKRSIKQIMDDGIQHQFVPGLKDLAVDILAAGAGMFVGAAMGRPSLLVGATVNLAGHMLEKNALSSFGIGMAAVNVVQGNPLVTLNGVESTKKEKAKARLQALKDDLYYKLYLDKIFKKKETTTNTDTTTTNTSGEAPVGEVKYFVYPGSESSVADMDLTGLDEIEQSIVNSAMQYQQTKNYNEPETVKNSNPDISTMGFTDPLY